MTKQYCISCLVFISYLKLLNAASIPLRPLKQSTSTYKPSTLLLPPGFDSQKVPRQPMLYPYAMASLDITVRPELKNSPSTTPDWIPVALNVRSDLPLLPNSHSTNPTWSSHSIPVMEERISNDGPKYSSPLYEEGRVFESIVYGTWKPNRPLQPVVNGFNGFNGRKHQQHDDGLAVDGKAFNKTINRQHGGFIGQITQKPTKSSSKLSSVENKWKNSTKIYSEQMPKRKVKKQGRQKIRPIGSTTEENSIENNTNGQEATTINENIYNQRNFIKVNSTDPKLMEVVKQINESFKMRSEQKQNSTHSIEMITTMDVNDDKLDGFRTQWATKSTEFLNTEPQLNYDDDTFEIFENISASRKSWSTEFMKELLTTETNYQSINKSHELPINDGLETDISEIPLELSALNIPPSLWPKLPGNITKLGKPYETVSSAKEPALCVPITVREQNIMNSNDLVYIERIFCFPMPQSSTTFDNNDDSLEGSTTTAKVQNFNDFIDSNSQVLNASSYFKNHFYLIASILVIFLFKFIA